MKNFVVAVIIALGLGATAVSAVSAAPAAGGPLAQAAGENSGIEKVWFDRFGVWHPNRARYIAPPVVVVPACRMVQVCNRWGRCWMKQRCY